MLPQIYKVENLAPVMPTRAFLHDRAAAWAEEEYGRRSTIPFLWLIAIRSEILWLETPWEDEREKRAMTSMVAAVLESKKAHAYAFMCEAWVSVEKVEPGQVPNADDFVPPSERPENEREDVMFISSEDRAGAGGLTRYLVTTRPNGRNLLGPRVDEKSVFTGRMFNLFNRAVAL